MKPFILLTFLLAGQLAKAQLQVNEKSTALAIGNLPGQGMWTTVNTSIIMSQANTTSFSAFTGVGRQLGQAGTAATYITEDPSYSLQTRWLQADVLKAANDKPLIEWEVTENNMAHYIVERSVHGDPFTEVGRLASLGKGQHRYELADPAYTTGRAQYRIKQVDLFGNYRLSHLLYFNENDIERSYVFPNPASRVINLVVKPSLINSQAFLYNSAGQIIQRISVNGTRTDITCANLGKGFYILKLQDGTALRIIKD